MAPAMKGAIMAQADIRELADEVAALMAQRLGGARGAEAVDLPRMVRRKGAALPKRLRGRAEWLAEASVQAGHPRIARQLDQRQAVAAHRALTRHLRRFGEGRRLANGALDMAARVMMALLVVGGLVVWYLASSGRL